MKRTELFISLNTIVFLSLVTHSYSQEIPQLEDGQVYVAFSSDHEGEREAEDTSQLEFEAIYILSSEHFGGSYDDMIRQGIRVSPLGGCREPVWDLEGDRLAYIELDLDTNKTKITIIDFNERERRTLSSEKASSVAGLSWSADGVKLAYVDHDVGICLADIETGNSTVVFEHPRPKYVTMSPDGKWIVFQSSDGPKPYDHDSWRLNLLNLETDEHFTIGELDDNEGVVERMYWSSNSQAVYVPLRYSIEVDDAREYKPSLFQIETMEFEAAPELPEDIFDQQFRFWKIVQ